MTSNPCPGGRRDAIALAAMNLRPVVGSLGVVYFATPAPKVAPVDKMTARYQPRNQFGRFEPYAVLRRAITREYSLTACEYDRRAGYGTTDDVS